MNIETLEANIQSLVTNLNKNTFIYDLLLAYEQPKSTIARLQKGDYNLSKTPCEILWKKKLFFKKETVSDLHGCIDKLKSDPTIIKHHPRFIIVTDFQTLLSIDTKTNDTLDIPILDLAKHYDFFLPWAGMEKSQFQSENPADIKAAYRMGQLYDLILKDNHIKDDNDRHALNIFLSRLLFCFFAEDTGIFANDQFTNAVASHTVEDGSDLQPYLEKLFKVLNSKNRSSYPKFLQDFPYVNGGLFADYYPVPKFSTKSRKIIIECGALNWKAINPDIFGSMMQAVMQDEERDRIGMHYTSVVNIMKVIEPLFLNDLYDELEQAGNNEKKLKKILDRLSRLRIFDPACGSGNFLIIAYKELCKLEIEIFKRLHGKQLSQRFLSSIHLTQFYGIEIDDFAHETAKLSLWLAEHQMNLAFKKVFGETRPTLPLKDGGNIVCGNATRLNWEEICPKDKSCEIYVLGNPPYLGSSMQSKEQKADMVHVFNAFESYKNLDYITCWFLIGSRYIQNYGAQLAFVSTNSISQGEQVGLLWPHVFSMNLEICFGHQSFKWTNNAKGNAGVICVVIGLRNICDKPKLLFKDSISRSVKNISPYLTSGNNICVRRRTKPLGMLHEMVKGNQPTDGGNFILSTQEKETLISHFPGAKIFVKKYYGAQEFIKGIERWCLWINNENMLDAERIPDIKSRIEAVKSVRLASKAPSTNVFSGGDHRFIQIQHEPAKALIIPKVSSERRDYIPIGFLNNDSVISDLAFAIYDPSPFIFAIISSRIHMTWVRAVAGRLKTDYRYSSALCYNTFPFPKIDKTKTNTLENHVLEVLDEREKYPEKTLAQLYDPDKMPDGLRQAHHEMDLAVEQCYRKKPFENDEERLEYLFKLYEEMIEAETR